MKEILISAILALAFGRLAWEAAFNCGDSPLAVFISAYGILLCLIMVSVLCKAVKYRRKC